MTKNFVVILFVTCSIFLVSITYAYSIKFNESISKNELLKQEPCKNGQHYLDKGLCIDGNYKIERPPINGIIPVYSVVNEMVILEINEKDKTIEIEFGVSRFWRDERFKVNQKLANRPPYAFFVYYDKILPPMWFPEGTKFKNKRRMKQSHDPATFIGINPPHDPRIPNGTYVWAYHEFQLSLFCDFHFTEFPMDTHSCTFVETNENARDLQLLPGLEQENHFFPLFQKDGFEVETSFVHRDNFGNSNLSYCGFILRLKRIYSLYVFQYYLPGAAIVFLSHVSFIIPPSSIPGRIGFLATLFLTLMNICINHMVSILRYIYVCIYMCI